MQYIPDRYREYYKIKRNNFFASIQGFPEMWKFYMLLDVMWLREFEVMRPATDPDRMFPMILYYNAHAKIRISIELALSECMSEARSILRDGIEFVAHAHSMLADPTLQAVWLNKNDEGQAFKEAFEHSKKYQVFKGLEELHSSWAQLSETGSHSSLNAICDRFGQTETTVGVEFSLRYCGVEPQIWAMSLFSMLLTCSTMERTMYGDYNGRLKLDDVLLRMRSEFERYKEQLREVLKIRYNLKPPDSISSIYIP
jgi:hypothetical protein